jgi:glycogen debranching enzyme
VLDYVTRTQAKELIHEKDAEPGKIFHETREGEMCELNEVPFKMYYGTIDATPLFIMLAGAYYRRTADINYIKKIWPNIISAINWIDDYGDIDGDGFVEYAMKSEKGLINQGWKDSFDSISHADGKLAESPIALCEVQGYVYDAKIQAAMLAEVLGENNLALELKEEAAQLKKKFNEMFWDDELNCFVIALDGDKKPCRLISSNAGHALFTGIADVEKAGKLVEVLMKNNMFTGFGIRTLASGEVRYNPMSYHNGSVWPHDTALIAYGFSRYGYQLEVLKIMQGLFDAALYFELQRLPELFCGFSREKSKAPIEYPVACSPQAWSVASLYMILQSAMGLEINAVNKKIIFKKPLLPKFLASVQLDGLILEKELTRIELKKYRKDTGINVLEKKDDWDVLVIK